MANYLCKKFVPTITLSYNASVTEGRTDGQTDENHVNTRPLLRPKYGRLRIHQKYIKLTYEPIILKTGYIASL